MRPWRAVLVYLVVVFLGGALVAPWLYAVIQWGAAHCPALQSLAGNPFHRFVNRAVLGLAVLGLWPFLRVVGIRCWQDVGLPRPAGHWKKLGLGFAIGFGSLAGLALLTIVAGIRQVDFEHSATDMGRHLGNAALAAAVVGLLEEVLFRGALFGVLSRAHRWTWALWGSSAIYAGVHFFERPASPTVIDWMSGVVVLCRMMSGFGDLTQLVPVFFNLTLVGLLLGWAYHRTGTIYCSIGLHAGWIFWLKSFGVLTRETSGTNVWLWGTGKMIDGWVTLGVLGLTLLLLRKVLAVLEKRQEMR